jgi:hypothetical protein
MSGVPCDITREELQFAGLSIMDECPSCHNKGFTHFAKSVAVHANQAEATTINNAEVEITTCASEDKSSSKCVLKYKEIDHSSSSTTTSSCNSNSNSNSNNATVLAAKALLAEVWDSSSSEGEVLDSIPPKYGLSKRANTNKSARRSERSGGTPSDRQAAKKKDTKESPALGGGGGGGGRGGGGGGGGCLPFPSMGEGDVILLEGDSIEINNVLNYPGLGEVVDLLNPNLNVNPTKQHLKPFQWRSSSLKVTLAAGELLQPNVLKALRENLENDTDPLNRLLLQQLESKISELSVVLNELTNVNPLIRNNPKTGKLLRIITIITIIIIIITIITIIIIIIIIITCITIITRRHFA